MLDTELQEAEKKLQDIFGKETLEKHTCKKASWNLNSASIIQIEL